MLPGFFKIIRNFAIMNTLIVKEKTFFFSGSSFNNFLLSIRKTHFRIKGLLEDRNYFIVR